MEKKKEKVRLPIFSYVGYLLVASFLLTGVTFSGYVTGTNGSDDARVARFEIYESGVSETTITADIVPGQTVEKELLIQNKSEVSIDYTVEIVNVTENLPITFAVSGTPTVGGKFSDTIDAGEPTKAYKLQIVWSAEENSPEYVGMIDQLKVSVSATQKD